MRGCPDVKTKGRSPAAEERTKLASMLFRRIIHFAFGVGGTFLLLFMLTTIGLLLMLLVAAKHTP